jgi:hypothetical protein
MPTASAHRWQECRSENGWAWGWARVPKIASGIHFPSSGKIHTVNRKRDGEFRLVGGLSCWKLHRNLHWKICFQAVGWKNSEMIFTGVSLGCHLTVKISWRLHASTENAICEGWEACCIDGAELLKKMGLNIAHRGGRNAAEKMGELGAEMEFYKLLLEFTSRAQGKYTQWREKGMVSSGSWEGKAADNCTEICTERSAFRLWAEKNVKWLSLEFH